MWKRFRDVFGAENVTDHLADAYFTQAELHQIFSRKVVAGHLGWRDFWSKRDNRFGMAVLREPVERQVSHYYFHLHLADPNDVARKVANSFYIEDYFGRRPAGAGAVGNMAVRQLGAHQLDQEVDFPLALKRAKETLKWCRWVGFYDTLRSDLVRLSNLDSALAPMAFLSRERVTPPHPPASRDVLNTIRRSNEFDLELYHWAKEQFRSKGTPDVIPQTLYVPPPIEALMEKHLYDYRGAFIELQIRNGATDSFGCWTISWQDTTYQSEFYVTCSASELMADAKAHLDGLLQFSNKSDSR